MDEGSMVVAIVAIACGTGVMLTLLNTIRAAVSGKARRSQDALVAEVRELRDEMRQLRQQNNDIILALDSSPSRRLSGLESRASSEVEQPLRRG